MGKVSYKNVLGALKTSQFVILIRRLAEKDLENALNNLLSEIFLPKTSRWETPFRMTEQVLQSSLLNKNHNNT